MLIAVDKKTYHVVNNKNDYVYIFDKENLHDLEKTKLHCVNCKDIDYVDINLTDYEINCLKKASISEKDFDKLEKKDYKFAVIIPNCNNDHGEYNGKTYLQNSIESVLNQTYKKFELIVVDDVSTDTSVKTIQKYKDKRLHLIQNIRKRYNGGSRNVGIEYALGLDIDYICFLDSDDWWKNETVLEHINKRLYNNDMLIIGAEMLFENGNTFKTFNEWRNYKEFFISEGKDGKLWCTAWSRVIRKDKIAWFCEDTLMEDRVWSYKQADNVDYSKVINLKEICYVWNRLNTTNSVSMVRNYFWDASAYCHIGHQLQFLGQLKHEEMKNIIEERIHRCKNNCNKGIYQQE